MLLYYNTAQARHAIFIQRKLIAKFPAYWQDRVIRFFMCAGVAKLVDAQDLKSWVQQWTYRFDSGSRHHFFFSYYKSQSS